VLALAAGTLGCSTFIGTTAASFLNRVRKDPDPNIRYIAYSKLASPNCYDNAQQKAEAVKLLVAKLQKGAEPTATRAVICHTLGELRDPAARDAILKAANDPDAVVKIQACRALGKVGRPEDATLLARVMAIDPMEDCKIAAVEALAELKPDDPRIAQMLVGGMQNDDPAIRYASLNALRSITGRDLGVDPKPWVKLVEERTQKALAAREASTNSPASEPSAAPDQAPVPAITQALPPAYPPRAPAHADQDGETLPASVSTPAPRTFPTPR
jgi:hypothetical protein